MKEKTEGTGECQGETAVAHRKMGVYKGKKGNRVIG